MTEGILNKRWKLFIPLERIQATPVKLGFGLAVSTSPCLFVSGTYREEEKSDLIEIE